SPTGAPAPARSEAGRLLARASALLRERDIAGARLLLERAVEEGSAQAAYELARTYDPRVLASWSALGVPADPARARALYTRARAGGVAFDTELLVNLK
ncbi:hypothetical protein SLNSH_23700, partial [Alsobacter soli]